ncbi:MAG: lysoplasmalogenase [Bacteriovoracaceae bacterium]|nr:lysoplasmalogenase [Bacteriovoracaceae bacterium]
MNKMIIRLYWIFAILFIISLPFRPIPGSFVIKAIPALSIAFLLISNRTHGRGLLLMGIGFVFSAAGDVFLDINRETLFVQGLGSFLVAHVLYASALFSDRGSLKSKYPYLLSILLISIVMTVLLFPKLGNLTIPVCLYLLAITVMGVSACLYNSTNWMIPSGAVIFMISDSIIATSKFLIPLSWAPLAIMITYFVGNFLIGYGMFRSKITS